jgi:tRNA pseudouridine38-40 synthase
VRTVKLTIAYDGTDFVGWQRQENGTSIQGCLEEALSAIDGAPVTLHGAGRTDAGAHAVGQVASARLATALDDHQLQRALNAHLPETIRITGLRTAADDFHARFSARGKTYEYRIWNGRTLPPFVRHYAWHRIGSLDVALMQQGSDAIPGIRDFAAFRSARSINHTTVREITAATWRRGDGEMLVFEISGRGFLRYMVRSLVGTLVEIGRGQRQPEDIARLLAQPDRSAAGRTAPARGLFLMKVEY